MPPDHLLARLARRRPSERLPRRAALTALLDRLGSPEQGLAVVQIAGSRGKGSTALLLETVLEAAGVSTGTFTSPHLQRWTERFRLGGREISAPRLHAALATLEPMVAELEPAGLVEGLSFFDAATATALRLFRDAEVDCAILEAGLGGGRDATCLARPAVTCLTGVELEHAALLGGSLQAVAREKAGIARQGVPLVLGELPAVAAPIVRAHAAAVGAPVVAAGEDFRTRVEPTDTGCRLWFDGLGLAVEAELPFLGEHLADCAALALACAAQLVPDRAALTQAAAGALPAARLPGRAEVLAARPWLLADGAHTEDAMTALAAVLARLPHAGLELVVSVSGERDPAVLCAPLRPALRAVTATCAEPGRSRPPDAVAAGLRAAWPEVPIGVMSEPEAALASAMARAAPTGLVCATGSVYMAGRARAWYGRRRASPEHG